MWYNLRGMIYGWYSAGYSLMELVASPDSPAMVTGDISGRNSVLVHIDGVETEEDASAITSITWSVRSPTGSLMDYPLDPDIVFQSLPPLPKGRRLRFFEEGKEYLFFRFQIPQEMLTEPGAGAITPRFKVGEDFKAGTLLTYAVFKGNANDEDSLITKSQYDYLLAYVDRGLTAEEGDGRYVRLNPDGTLPTQRMQTILGDIQISASDAIIQDSFITLAGYNGKPSLFAKRGRGASTTTLFLYPKEGTLSSPVTLNTPDEGGILATREWVNEHAQPEEPVFDVSFTADQYFIPLAIGRIQNATIENQSLNEFLVAGKGEVHLSVIALGMSINFVLKPVMSLAIEHPYWSATITQSLDLTSMYGGKVNTFAVSIAPQLDKTSTLSLSIIPVDTLSSGDLILKNLDYAFKITPPILSEGSGGDINVNLPETDGTDVTLATREWVNSNIDISWEDYPD